jgi:aminoglycoside 3-N-acetyltransferase
MAIDQREIRGGLRGLGFKPGETVIVHSSLSALGWVESGAEAVVDALLASVGEEGTVVMPTFTSYDEPYDPVDSESTTGAVTEMFRQRENVRRSDHPTKSVAVCGSDAERLTSDHELMRPLGVRSPLHRALEAGAKILLLGVDHTTNSSLHVAEAVAGLPYRDQTTETSRVTEDGGRESVVVNRVHCSAGFNKIGPVAERAGIVSRGLIGDAETQLIAGDGLLSVAMSAFEADPGFLLCNAPDCGRCQYARDRLDETGMLPEGPE